MNDHDPVTRREYEQRIDELCKEIDRLKEAIAVLTTWKSNLEGRMAGWTSVAVLLGLVSLCLGIWASIR